MGLEGAAGGQNAVALPRKAARSQEGDQRFPSKALASGLGNCTQPPNRQDLCFSRVVATARLDPEGLPCLELLTRSRCQFLDAVVPACGSSITPGAVLQLGSTGMQQKNTSNLRMAETWEKWSHLLMDTRTVSNRGRDPAQTLRSRYVTKPKSSFPL